MTNTNLLRDESGASAIEYAILIALIAIAISVSVFALGEQNSETYAAAQSGMESGGGGGSQPPADPPRRPGRPGGGNAVPG